MNNHRVLIWVMLILLNAIPALAKPLSLDECLNLARQHNPALQAAAATPRLAAIDTDSSRSSYRPRAEVKAGYTQQQAAQQAVTNDSSLPTQDKGYAFARLSVDQLLYDFGRSKSRVSAAESQQQAAEFSYTATEQNLLLQTAVAYYRILNTEALLKAARDETSQTQAHLETAQALFEAGVVTRNDVLQAEVRLADSRQQVIALEGNLENDWLGLNYLTGRPVSARGELTADDNFFLPSSELKPVTPQRPDLQAQRSRVTGARELIGEAEADYRPELYSHLGIDYLENSHVKEQTIYSGTVGIRFTLYDGANRDLRLSKARESLRREQHRLEDLQFRAQLEEQTARNDAKVAEQQIAVAELAITQARENLRINQDRYREQVGTATEVLDAQTLLTKTRTDLAQAQLNYQLAVARWKYAIGQL